MAFREADDKLWVNIKPFLLPGKPKTGRPRTELRRAFNGILYVLTTGSAWLDIPRVYGTKSTIYRLHLELCRNGAYKQILQIFLSERYELKKLNYFKINKGAGRPITRPCAINRDYAYDSEEIRSYNRRRGIKPTYR